MPGFSGLVRNSFYSLLIIVAVSATACASGGLEGIDDNVRADNGLIQIKNNDAVKEQGNSYEEYLVDINSYSTNGGYYQKKYNRDILEIARNITEKQDIDISKGSVGFYFDKKSKKTDRLFFGFDIIVNKENNSDYGRFAAKLIKENVTGIIDEIYRYKFVPSENEVVGIVIGFRWSEDSSNQLVNIWITKEDIALFLEERLTANEMFQRGTITNSTGRVILLPI